MLSTPVYGWTHITVGEHSSRASYLTDVPMDLLDGFLLNPDDFFVVHFDAEGWDFEVVVHQNFTSMIKYNDIDDIEVYKSVYISKSKLALEVVDDIEKDLDGWVKWMYTSEEFNTARLSKRKKKIIEKIAKIRQLYKED